MPRASRRTLSRYVEPFAFDPNPLYASDLGPPTAEGVRKVLNWPAFDPRYGPESERQIEWHRKRGVAGSEFWEVGVPVLAYA